MATTDRPFITCHVLDQSKGRPAANVRVALKLASANSEAEHVLTARTNSDGRVEGWRHSADSSGITTPQALVSKLKDGGNLVNDARLVWTITFFIEEYLGEGATFYPKVDVTFYTDAGRSHFHVPLLLGPWGYTTYRGS